MRIHLNLAYFLGFWLSHAYFEGVFLCFEENNRACNSASIATSFSSWIKVMMSDLGFSPINYLENFIKMTMAFIKVYIHFIWSTKNRESFLDSPELRKKV